MMVTSSLRCGEFYILYIDLPCVHYAGDVTIIQHIVYIYIPIRRNIKVNHRFIYQI